MIKLKSHEVLTLLKISRPTLTKYVKTGVIKVITLPNGQYDYDKQSVMELFHETVLERQNPENQGGNRI